MNGSASLVHFDVQGFRSPRLYWCIPCATGLFNNANTGTLRNMPPKSSARCSKTRTNTRERCGMCPSFRLLVLYCCPVLSCDVNYDATTAQGKNNLFRVFLTYTLGLAAAGDVQSLREAKVAVELARDLGVLRLRCSRKNACSKKIYGTSSQRN